MNKVHVRNRSDDYHTCQKCSTVSLYSKWLDDKPICGACLDEILHGEDRRICASRGFHVTNSSSCHHHYPTTMGVAEFVLSIRCKCGQEGRHVQTVKGVNEYGSMLSYPIPRGPSKWRVENGRVIVIEDEEPAGHANDLSQRKETSID